MHFRQKLTFMALGSILTIAGYLLATLTSDVTAQSETDKSEPLIVDEIVCRQLRVVDENDKTRVEIVAYPNGGNVFVRNADDKSVVYIGAHSDGYVSVREASGKKVVSINAYKGGDISVTNASGKKVVNIGAFRDSGYMKVNRADGENVVNIGEILNGGYMKVNRADGETGVFISPNDGDNGGLVSVYGKEGGEAQLSANEHGGLLGIYGKTDDKSRVLIGINEKGHGTINTWDKNRYRTRP